MLAVLFTVTVGLEVRSAIASLQHVPIDVAKFAPGGDGTLFIVDARAAAAGLHEGDILVAINHRPYTGSIVYWETLAQARPGTPLLVTVRSPGANAQDRSIALPVTSNIPRLKKPIGSSVAYLIHGRRRGSQRGTLRQYSS